MIYKITKDAQNDYQYKQAIRNGAIIELLFATGIRISELCYLKNEDVDLKERMIKIFGKGSKERYIYLGNEQVVNILVKYKKLTVHEESEYFFINKYHERLSEQSVRIYIQQLGKRLSQPIHLTPHMFRHTFATMLLDKDVDIRHIQKILGHSSISITQIYTHVSNTKQKEILIAKNPRNDYMKIHI
ncbi:tyrosine-type recombinase/integrase [Candidatus Stoquefichus massiliensis]|uniref:tyrosine-type recombinase/integrase n=1 Tax=Candidatus Stoquefichus massiliensis TaxID=1470350 RepID=UPI00164EC5EF|nr:tyrosine-type recombinase/integrase [Candidatus Stoquefichus massiliensis]